MNRILKQTYNCRIESRRNSKRKSVLPDQEEAMESFRYFIKLVVSFVEFFETQPQLEVNIHFH